MNTKYYISIIALIILSFSANAQEDWGITEEEKATMMTIEFNTETIELGADLYQSKTCASCHGLPNEAPNPETFPDLGRAETLANTDGELFYKITRGKGLMPKFDALTTEEERWQIIAYMRSFDANYTPAGGEAVAMAPGEKFSGKITAMDFTVDTENHKLIAKLKGKDAAGNTVIPAEVKVEFFVDRMFGDLMIDKAVKTDVNGEASIEYPTNLPADTAGMMMFYAQLKDKKLGDIKAEATVDTGVPMVYKNPLSERVMWGPMANIPYWLLFTYLGILLFVWSGIAWVGLQLFKIWMLREK